MPESLSKDRKEIAFSIFGFASSALLATLYPVFGLPALVGNIGTNVASEYFNNITYSQIKDKWIKSPQHGMMNHHIQKALGRAICGAISRLKLQYQESSTSRYDREGAERFFNNILNNIKDILSGIEEGKGLYGLTDMEAQQYLHGIDHREGTQLLRMLEIETENYAPKIKVLFETDFPQLVQKCFQEELKTDQPAQWAMQSLIFQVFQQKMDHIIVNGSEHYEGVIAKIEVLKEVVDRKQNGGSLWTELSQRALDDCMKFQEMILEKINKVYGDTRYIRTKVTDINKLLESNIHLKYDRDEVMKNYLEWVIKKHSKLFLHSIPEASIFPYVDLDTVYVALKVDKTSNNEILNDNFLLEEELHRLVIEQSGKMDQELLERLRANVFKEKPIPKAWQAQYQSIQDYSNEDIIPFSEAFQLERKLVILGDPGSGKTTVARWLALQLAKGMQAYRNNIHGLGAGRLVVKEHQVSPDQMESERLIDLGPVRVPIIVKISDYAEYYEAEPISLTEYLGRHTWDKESIQNANGPIPFAHLNDLFTSLLRQDKVVVILDGMDEVTKNRSDILREIESFVRIWIDKSEGGLVRRKNMGTPIETGGNQILITSRIVGYHAAPINAELTRVFVEPMQKTAVSHFCRVWTYAVNCHIYRETWPLEKIREKSEEEAEGLIEAIYDDSKPRIRELAGNPLLVTILALVYKHNQGVLPEQRAMLYALAIERLYKNWRKGPLDIEEISFVLAPLAFEMHQRHGSGMIEETELKEIIKLQLGIYKRSMEFEPTPVALEKMAESFLEEIRQNVGILSCRSERLYGFLHLTFQEFLAGKFMVSNREDAARLIIEKLDQPRWKEPVLLAIGQKSIKSTKPVFNEFVLEILEADKQLGEVFPVGTFLMVSALREVDLYKVEDHILFRIVDRLTHLYSQRELIHKFPQIGEALEKSVEAIQNNEQLRPRMERLIVKLISTSKKEDQIMAIAQLLMRFNWFWSDVLESYFGLLHLDKANWSFVMHRMLQRCLSLIVSPPNIPAPKELISLEALEYQIDLYRELKFQRQYADTYRQRFLYNLEEGLEQVYFRHLRLRKRLVRQEAWVEKINANFWLQRLCVVLYGGFGDMGHEEHVNLNSFLHEFIAKDARERQEITARFPQYHIFYQGFLEKWDLYKYGKSKGGAIWDELNSALYIDFNGNIQANFKNLENEESFQFSDPELKEEIYQLLSGIHQWNEYLNLTDASLQFSPKYFFKGSHIDDIVLDLIKVDNLEKEVIITTLKEGITSCEAAEKVDRLLGLWALGEDMQSLFRQYNFPDHAALKMQFSRQIGILKATIKDGLLRSKTGIKTILESEVAEKLKIEYWEYLFRWAGETLQAETGLSLPINWVFTSSSATKSPILLVNTLARMLWEIMPDKDYSLAVTLDTIPKKDTSHYMDMLLNAYKAPNISVNKLGTTSWNVDLFPIKPFLNDIPLEAFDNLTSLHLNTQVENYLADGFVNIMLISYSDHLKENPDLLPEFILHCWVNSAFEAMRRVIRKYGILENSVFNAHTRTRAIPVTHLVDRIGSPYYRIRFLLVLFRYGIIDFTDLYTEFKELLPRVRTAEKKAYLLYWIYKLGQSDEQEALLQALNLQLEAVEDAENRVRLNLKALDYFGEEKQLVVLNRISRSLEQVPSELINAELVYLLRKWAQQRKVQPATLSQGYAMIKNPLLHHFTKGQTGTFWMSFDPPVERLKQADFIPLLLTSAAKEYLEAFDDSQSQSELWQGLLIEGQKVRALESILDKAQETGIQLNYEVTLVVNQLLNNKEIDLLAILLPLLEAPTSEALPLVYNWVDNPAFSYCHMDRISRFFLYENSREMKVEHVRNNLELQKERLPGRLMHRLKHFFDGGVNKIKRERRLFRSSRAEEGIYDLLVHSSTNLLKFCISTLFDDPGTFEYWQKKYEEEEKFQLLFLNLFEVNEESWVKFKEIYTSAPPKLKLHMFIGMINLHYETNRQDFRPPDIIETIQQTPPESIAEARFLPGHSLAIKEVYDAIGAFGDYPYFTAIDRAQQLLEEHIISLHQILPLPADQLSKVLNDLPEAVYHYNGSFFQYEEDKSSIIISNGDKGLPFLMAWLEETLENSVKNEHYFTFVSSLLEFVAIQAARYPATFERFLDQTTLKDFLLKVVREHDHSVGIVAAIKLLGLISNPDISVINGLLDVMVDPDTGSIYSTTTINQVMVNWQKGSPAIIDFLIQRLDSDQSTAVYVSIKVLQNIATHETTPVDKRRLILNDLLKRFKEPKYNKGVYELRGSGSERNPVVSTFITQLDDAMAVAIFEISGLNQLL